MTRTPQIAALPGMTPLGLPMAANMETKHTPGPWDHAEQVIFAPTGEAIASTWKFGQFDIGGRNSHDEAQANAQLMAAAPEMLAALRALLATNSCREATYNFNVSLAEAVDVARTAIAKAEGRQ